MLENILLVISVLLIAIVLLQGNKEHFFQAWHPHHKHRCIRLLPSPKHRLERPLFLPYQYGR